jgi:hypothetical protein
MENDCWPVAEAKKKKYKLSCVWFIVGIPKHKSWNIDSVWAQQLSMAVTISRSIGLE